MEAIPMEDREGYLEAMERLRSQQSVELTASLQNSIEIGETAKGFLYLKSCKIYFGQAHDDEAVLNRLFKMYDRAVVEIALREGRKEK